MDRKHYHECLLLILSYCSISSTLTFYIMLRGSATVHKQNQSAVGPPPALSIQSYLCITTCLSVFISKCLMAFGIKYSLSLTLSLWLPPFFPAAYSDSKEADETLISWIQVPTRAVCTGWEHYKHTAHSYKLTHGVISFLLSSYRW